MINDLLNELRIALPHRLDEIEALATPEAKARIIRNVRVQSLLGFRANVLGVLERRSIAVIRIKQPNKPVVKPHQARLHGSERSAHGDVAADRG